MAQRLERGEIWLLQRPRPDKRRPVLVLSRPALLRAMHSVTVASITSTLRGSPTEVPLGVEEGLKNPCCVNLCNLFTVEQHRLGTDVGALSNTKMRQVCQALNIALACD